MKKDNKSSDWKNEFVNFLSSPKIDEVKIEEAMMLKHKNLPYKIYKYRSVNEDSLNNLRNNTVWLSAPEGFNDPYDCSMAISFEEMGKATSKQHFDQIAKKVGLD